MRKLAIAAAVSMSLATLSVNTHALGLGEIEMYSALNQALDAEIGIVSYGPNELEGLNVRLAPAEAFAAAGLARTEVLAQMQFDIEQRPDGVPVIKITSDGPIIEPFLSFLLELDSPVGSTVVREYTVLLDPPVFVAQQSEMVVDTPAFSTTDDLQGDSAGVSSPVDRGEDLLAGVVVDLLSEVGDTSGSVIQDGQSNAVTLDLSALADPNGRAESQAMQTAQLLDTVDDSAVVVGQLSADPLFVGGEVVDLTAEVLGGSDAVVGGGATFDVSLSDLETDAIFANPTPEDTTSLSDQDENIVSLDQLSAEAESAANTMTGSVGNSAFEGDLLDLSQLAGDGVFATAESESMAEADSVATSFDIAEIDTDAEVTFEEVKTTTVPVASVSVGSGSGSPVSVASADSVLGEQIDLSGVVAGDLSNLLAPTTVTNSFTSDGYSVQADDTLWSIARTQKAAGVSTQQMVVAILDANPDAFIDGDMNRLRNGAVLQIPAEFAAISNSEAIAMVRENAPAAGSADSNSGISSETAESASSAEPVVEGLNIVAVDDSANGSGTAATEQQSVGSDLERNLDEVNKKMLLAQEELTSESLQRDELSERVVELEDSLDKMKKLITLRESELGNLQTELTTAQTDSSEKAMEAAEKTRQLELAESEKSSVQEDLKRLQDSISADASMAQERVAAQADADKNLASAEAEVQSIRLSTEEDAIKAQLAQLKLEKETLEKTAQNDKLALLKQSEAEKAQLLNEAKAERERIQASLEAEKARITEAAAAERLQIAEQAELEKEQLIATANAERDRLAAESEAMRLKLATLEEEKTRLLAEAEADKAELAQVNKQAAEDQSRLQAEAEAEKLKFEEESERVKDRLAALQAEASANLAKNEPAEEVVAAVVASETEATTLPAMETETGSGGLSQDLASKGTAAVGGLLAFAPLQRVMGDRKKVLAAGGGVALLGLLGAWATRRRKPVRDIPVDIDTTEDLGKSARTTFDSRPDTSEAIEQPRSTMGRAAVAASAAAAASGAVVPRETSAEAPSAPVSEAPGADHPVQTEVNTESDLAHQPADSTLLDDTITEADVYLRYGLHGQAEDLLQTAIERAPDNEEYHLKLLENYHTQENADAFKAAAANYQNRFGLSGNWERVAEMGRDIDSGDSLFSRVGGIDAKAAGASAAVAAAAAAAAASSQAGSAADLDRTIDAGAEFNMDDLAATGDFSGDDTFGIADLDDVSLDEVDLAALDDDGTLNLEEIAGNQMSGLDLGSLDLTNPGDSTLDNLTLDDADLNSLGLNTGNSGGELDSDLELSGGYVADSSEMETMLDLAKAYIDMGDSSSAANTLRDIVANGNPAQQKEASDLLKNLT